MAQSFTEQLKYSIFDPTGNITALVESSVAMEEQPFAASEILARHPEVEQVGFVRFHKEKPYDAELRMAGGEFCGNAAMCAASLYYLRKNACPDFHDSGEVLSVLLNVSGSSGTTQVVLEPEENNSFQAGILLHEPLEISDKIFYFQEKNSVLPVVKMEGISHVIIRPESVFYKLSDSKADAEDAVRSWCGDDPCLGLMFLSETGLGYRLTPLVYVPGSHTVFWENSCASGSAAAGMFLSFVSGRPVDVSFQEPGGKLRVKSSGKQTWLYGKTRLLHQYGSSSE